MGRGPNTTDAQRLAIIQWLRNRDNFGLITGNAGQGSVVAGVKRKKSDAYKSLASAVNRACNSDWSLQRTKSRYESYYKQYKDAKRASMQTGFGCSSEDMNNGIVTIEMKLNELCPFFPEMDGLFGDRQNIVPSAVSETGLSEDDDAADSSSSEEGDSFGGDGRSAPSAPSSPGGNLASSSSLEGERRPKATVTPAPSKATAAKTPGRKDFSTAFVESQDSLRELKKAKLELAREQVAQEIQMREKELALKKEEVQLKKEESRLREKEETKRMILKTLIEQGKSAAEAKEYLSAILSFSE